jgi:putative ABC transport system permease protein
MDTVLSDLKYSIRIFLKSPDFTITVMLALALGIGATTAIFSVVNAVLLKPLPIFDSDRFVMLMSTWVSETGERKSFSDASPAKFEHWRAQSSVVQDVSAFVPGVINYTRGDVMEQLRSMRASSDFFRCWAIKILRGRTFTPEEDLPNGPRIALISQGLWMRRFAGDPQILGKTILLDGEPYVVIGIAADSPSLGEFGPPPDVYVPFQLDPNTRDLGDFFKVVARLRRGVTLEQAKARLQTSVGEYRAKFPSSLAFGPKDGFNILRFRDAIVGDTRPLLLILLGAVGLVLLIACANVANLLLAQATGRRREIAIRAAMGAARGRMIHQLLTESVLLSFVGGALGLWLGYAGIRALLAVNTADLPLVGQNGSAVNIDWRVAGFAVAVSLVTGIVFGLFPALQASRVDLNSILKDSGGRSGTGLRQTKVRAGLVVSETGLAVILLVGSALLIRSFVALYRVDRGFETKNVVTMRTALTDPKYLKSVGAANMIRNGLQHIRLLPNVVAASTTCCLPLLQGFYGQPFEIIGKPPANGQDVPAGGWSVVSPGFFDVFQIPVRRGRTFADRDDERASPVVVINERMAKEYWKDDDPLRSRIVIGRGMMKEFKDEPRRQIVGIVGDMRNERLNADPLPMMYVPQAQLPNAENAWLARNGQMVWILRTRGAPNRLVPAIREQLRRTTGLPVSNILSMDEVMSLSTEKQRFNMLLMTVFGCAATLLAGLGIYGLMAYIVEQRTKEIGIRLAIGAEASQVRNMVVGQGMSLALVGVILGMLAAWGLSRLMESMLFGVKARDPLVFLAVPAMLGAVALMAVWLPANRASRVNPTDTLRYE